MIASELKPVFQKGFGLTSRALLRTKFHGVWVDRGGAFQGEIPRLQRENLFVYSTHSSWWDPVVFAFIAIDQMAYRTLAPMDAEQFKSYKSLRHVGVFGVEPGDGPAVETFLQRELNHHPRTLVWVTPQGVFAPNEVEQPAFKSGLSRWSNQAGALRLPVVIHYHLSDNSQPDIFIRFGEPIDPTFKGVEQDSEILRRALTQEAKILLERVWKSHLGSKFDYSLFKKA